MKKVFNIKLVLNFTDEESKEISDKEFCEALHSNFMDEMPFLGKENCIVEPVDKDEIISGLEKEQIDEMQEHKWAMKIADNKIKQLEKENNNLKDNFAEMDDLLKKMTNLIGDLSKQVKNLPKYSVGQEVYFIDRNKKAQPCIVCTIKTTKGYQSPAHKTQEIVSSTKYRLACEDYSILFDLDESYLYATKAKAEQEGL